MKVNIKGLVFTGFAAAILSANAMAASPASDINTVTSKSYVDAKVASGTTANSLSESTTVAPNQTQVINALATKQPIQSDSSYKVGQSNTWQPLNSAVAVASGGYLAKTNGDDGSVTLNIDTATQLQTDGSSLSSGSGKLITEGAVAEAVNAVSSGAAGAYQPKNLQKMKVATVDPNDSSVATWTGMDSAVVEAQNGYVDVALDNASGAVALNIDANKITDATEYTTGTGLTENSTNLITEGAVYATLNDSAIIGKGTLSISVNSAQTATFNANQSGNETINFTGIEETANKLTGSDTSTIDSHSTDATSYPSAAAVYNYVQSVTGGTTIPKKSSVCTDSTPCALVNESDGAHWRTMATASHPGGVLGDMCTDSTQCGTGYNCTNSACVATGA